MKHPFVYVPALLVLAAPAWADPCVSNTFDRPFPNAAAVESFVADVPSSQFPAFWQTGILDGHSYRLFSNGDGEVTAGDQTQNWAVIVNCSIAQQECDVTSEGTTPEDALRVADKLGQCFLGRDPVEIVPDPEPVEDTPAALPPVPGALEGVAVIEQAPQSPTNDAPCGADLVDEATDVATMQRLLILLGEDPGPVDGFLGATSFAAMDAFVEDSNWDTSVPDLIDLLDQLHCERTQ